MKSGMFHAKHCPTSGHKPGERGANRGLIRASFGRNSVVLALILGSAFTGCSSPEEMADKVGVAATANASSTSASAAAGSGQGGAVAFADNSGKDDASREFAYAWPAEVSAVPALVARFTDERDTLLAEQKTEWAEAVAEFAGQDCVACTNRSFEKTWEVVADLPRYLSLSASFYVYSGGAHGNGAYDALVWDREAKVAFDPKAMFGSPEALQGALGDAWCIALKTERTERLGEDYSDDSIFTCPPIADLTLLVGSSNKKAFNRIGLLAAPYVAGSYAEGTYEVTLPVTPAVLAAVKPEFKSAFSLAK